mmetsp:Transcript_98998/g.159630  ORF Transcript_98998/g.159630 Transcript_98998/m.159630 type:complete len:97 (-) Transcript_98998:396-686(-)
MAMVNQCQYCQIIQEVATTDVDKCKGGMAAVEPFCCNCASTKHHWPEYNEQACKQCKDRKDARKARKATINCFSLSGSLCACFKRERGAGDEAGSV